MLGVMSIVFSILCFVISLVTMIVFSTITARAVRKREIPRLNLTFSTHPAMFVVVCCSYAVFVIIFLILSVVWAKELLRTI